MKQRLNLLVLAVTSLVVVAFTVPLAALVARDADANARRAAEALAQTVASNVVQVAVEGGVEDLEARPPELPDRIGLVFPSGAVAGSVPVGALILADTAAAEQQALSAYTSDGWVLTLPVLTRDGAVVVTATLTTGELSEGVARAWVLLALLGLLVIGISLAVASRLGRSLTRTVAALGEAARSLASGDLSTRVEVDDPPELAAVAEAFNDMAPRLEALMEQEREEIADLSHRLRTPLARLRLQVERVGDEHLRSSLGENLDRMERAVDEMIAEARRRPERQPIGVADLGEFLRDRAEFWSVLAEEQGRTFGVRVDLPAACAVELSEADLTAALDAVLGNVFDHTDEGVAFDLRASAGAGTVTIVVEDRGAGFQPGIEPLARGVSGAGSTGLGLDIARRAAERAGGTLRAGSGRHGGASVELTLSLIRRPARS